MLVLTYRPNNIITQTIGIVGIVHITDKLLCFFVKTPHTTIPGSSPQNTAAVLKQTKSPLALCIPGNLWPSSRTGRFRKQLGKKSLRTNPNLSISTLQQTKTTNAKNVVGIVRIIEVTIYLRFQISIKHKTINTFSITGSYPKLLRIVAGKSRDRISAHRIAFSWTRSKMRKILSV